MFDVFWLYKNVYFTKNMNFELIWTRIKTVKHRVARRIRNNRIRFKNICANQRHETRSWVRVLRLGPGSGSVPGPVLAALLREDGDDVVALGRGGSLSSVLLAINLVLHKEMSLLLQVQVAVRARVALRVTELVPQLHQHPPAEQQYKQNSF